MESVAGLDVGMKHSTLCVVRRDGGSMKPVRRHRTVTPPLAIGEWLTAQGRRQVCTPRCMCARHGRRRYEPYWARACSSSARRSGAGSSPWPASRGRHRTGPGERQEVVVGNRDRGGRAWRRPGHGPEGPAGRLSCLG